MVIVTLALPEKLELHHLLQFARRLDAVKECDRFILDMGKERHFPPFPMLFLVAKVSEFRAKHPTAVIELLHQDLHSYYHPLHLTLTLYPQHLHVQSHHCHLRRLYLYHPKLLLCMRQLM